MLKLEDSMILEKYQIRGEILDGDYSLTAKVIDEGGKKYFAKWIKGIEKNSENRVKFFMID